MKLLRRVLVANRGEIAVRCIRACRELSIASVAIYTKADAHSLHVRLADSSVLLVDEGPRAYTDIDAILKVCAEQSIDAVLPGYGFLSENVEFSRRVEEVGMVFVGPHAEVISTMGLKHTARQHAIHAGVPVIRGSGLLQNASEALHEARALGFPIMLKASGGGGGMGQQICHSESDVGNAFANVESRSKALFKDAGVFLEKYYSESHHIEVQIFGNGSDVVHFGERECSIQRRHQKVIEECPSPYLEFRKELRNELTSCAVSLAKLIRYRSAGTVEFLVDDQTGDFFFLEMNTRLQVEHGITELCHDVDIVNLMLRQAQYQFQGLGGIPAEEMRDLQTKGDNTRGAAIEVRLCCDNPADSFLPCSGLIQEITWPVEEGLRIDTWILPGITVSPYFDSLLAKIMIHRSRRDETIRSLKEVLQDLMIGGITTNLAFLESILASDSFASGRTLTTFLDNQLDFQPQGVRVLNPGILTTIQQPQPRSTKGYGVPPSGPMDDFSAIIGNILVGNARVTECLEVMSVGPELLFLCAAVVAVTGSPFSVKLNSVQVDTWTSISIQPRDVLKIETCRRKGARCYLAVRGGFPTVPSWLGSKSTTPNLSLGGFQGRPLRIGDYLELEPCDESSKHTPCKIPASCINDLLSFDTIYVMHGPHDSDDYITATGRQNLYSALWEVDHNCSRTGIRLIGPKIEWARVVGGAAGGAHPSNTVDYPYPSPGGVNWTGDSPVIFPSDGPGFGGFVCSSTVPSADLWKLGQLSPGTKITLTPVSYHTARDLAAAKESFIKAIEIHVLTGSPLDASMTWPDIGSSASTDSDAILAIFPEDDHNAKMSLLQGGDSFVVINIDLEVGLGSSVSAELLSRAIRNVAGAHVFVHVNISSVTVEYDSAYLEQSAVVSMVKTAREQFQAITRPLSNRRLVLPIVFDHPSIKEAEQRYATLQRSEAAYLPDNVTYMAGNNGLSRRGDVFDILRRTRFLVVAVGFMTGLPLLLPLDSMSRLTSQKYNPTRIATPPGTVGFGGALFCIYPAEQPGGYMMLARSVPVWDTYGLHFGPSSATGGKPWLCEPFDVVEFEEVSIEKFDEAMASFEEGMYQLQIEHSTFDVAVELSREREQQSLPQVQEFKRTQEIASETMRVHEEALLESWSLKQQETQLAGVEDAGDAKSVSIRSPQVGKLWKVNVEVGDRVMDKQVVAVLETMKMEIPVVAQASHNSLTVKEIRLKAGALLSPGNIIIMLE